MQGRIFHSMTNKKGFLGIKCNYSPSVTIIGYKSPYATIRQNDWLEKKLVKVYSRYYYRVLISTSGRFWEEPKAIVSEKLDEITGGIPNDIQLKEFIGR